MRCDAIFQHGARVAVDDAGGQSFALVLDVGDAVAAVRREEGGPLLQCVAVDGARAGGIEGARGQDVVHAQAPPAPALFSTTTPAG
jgi:hypothetical protein